MPLKNGRSSEAEEQSTLFFWANYIKELEYMFAIPNGGSRNKIEAANLKRQGVKSGVPDIFLPVPKGEYHGLWVEMKIKGNKTTDNQDKWIEYLNKVGYKAIVCYGFEEARQAITKYLEL